MAREQSQIQRWMDAMKDWEETHPVPKFSCTFHWKDAQGFSKDAGCSRFYRESSLPFPVRPRTVQPPKRRKKKKVRIVSLEKRLRWMEIDARTMQYGSLNDDGVGVRRRIGVDWIGLRQCDVDKIIQAADDSPHSHISSKVESMRQGPAIIRRGFKTYTIV